MYFHSLKGGAYNLFKHEISASKTCKRFYQSDKVFGYKKYTAEKFKISDKIVQNRSSASNLYRLVNTFRTHGHKYANINPITISEEEVYCSELEISRFGFNSLNEIVSLPEGVVNYEAKQAALGDLLQWLKHTYCNLIGAEFQYLETEEEIEWFASEFEQMKPISDEAKIATAKILIESQAFDNFLAKRFASVKRYGGEGAENMLTFFNELFHLSVQDDLKHLIVAMPHRGRLNLLTGLLNFRPAEMFSKLRGNADFPDKYLCTGDVLSHSIVTSELTFADKPLRVSLLRNPSHLEVVNPVSMGKARAKQLYLKDGAYGDEFRWSDKVLNVIVHGDAAFTGQGVNQESLEISAVPHFEVGGSVHLIVNNQIGFTTPADRGRSSRYCSDLAKIIAAPVLHVNGDYPEEVIKATRLAFKYQRKFRKDVFIDLNCYRRWGHNEMDDPTFTNPKVYREKIHPRKTVPDLYAEKLVQEKIVTAHQCTEIYDEEFDWLNEELKLTENWVPNDVYFECQWQGIVQAKDEVTVWDTGIDPAIMALIGEKSVSYPEDFNIHPTILRGHVTNRLSKIEDGSNIDWALAETLAVGSLLYQDYNVRISGQDVGRGTFSQRHAMFVDQKTNNIHIPLNHLHPKQRGFLELANSILSEEAVLAFEYGMSIDNPNNLVVWEAQFGDFFNGAQIVFDTYVSSGEAKWIYQSGLTVLLPHGYDGAGPEHSSSRIERFLQMTDSKEDAVDGDNVNMHVCHPSTPAQYFHLLRRQMVRNFRKPLVVITPKSLLRAPECVSKFSDMIKGTYFQPVLGDDSVDSATVTKVLMTSGKHYYSLKKEREVYLEKDVAIVRIEGLCPFPTRELLEVLDQYKSAKTFIWCQEEPQNMGAWGFVKRRFENLTGRRIKYCGRPTSAAPAVGVGQLNKQQELQILSKPFLIS